MSENQDQKRKPKTKDKKKKRTSILRVLFVIILLSAFIGTGVVGGLVFAIIKGAKPIDPSNIYALLDENSYIFDNEGNLIERIQSDIRRTRVDYNQIPQDLKDAFIAIEDQDFFEHNGINPKRIVKSFIVNIQKGYLAQGGSTITQQLTRELYLTQEKKYSRKIIEAYYAMQLEKHLTKEQIFEAYLNTIYLGGGANGIQAASSAYFSKDVSELDLAESALIAGIARNPAKYSPLKTLKKEDVDPSKHHIIDDSDEIYTIVYDDRYKPRQELVLSIMKNEGMITEEEYNQALNEDLKDHLKPGKSKNADISSFFADQVKHDVVQALKTELGKTEEEALDMLYNQGLRIYSTMDLKMQKVLEKTFQENKHFPDLVAPKDGSGNILNNGKSSILLYKQSNLINGNNELVIPKNDYKYDENGNLVLLKGKRLTFAPLYDNGERVGTQILVKDAYIQNQDKEYLMLKGGPLRIPAEYKTMNDDGNLIVGRAFLDANPSFFRKDGNENLLIAKENYSISDKGVIQPQSAMVIIDYHNGEIKALVGGRDVKGQKLYNRAINPRQPGSSIKPLSVYTPAIDNGWTAADVVDDIPNYRNGKLWPNNYDHKYRGLTTLREGIQRSSNVVAVSVVERIGVNTSVEYLKKFGITTVDEKGGQNDINLASMALGGMTNGISPLELTAGYGTIANKGVYVKPKSFTKITDRNGDIILENTSLKNMVVSPETAFIVTDMMRSVITSGTGQRASLDHLNIPVAGKTGTTSDNYDAWFAGFSPYYVGAVWIGNDIQMKLNQGSAASAQLWKEVMAEIHKDLPPRNFEKPENIVSAQIDTKSGKLPTELSFRDPRGTVRNEYFIKGTVPNEYDDVHVEVEVDTSTNQLATPYCPPTLVEKRVYTQRLVPYDPSQHGNLVPEDYSYEAPTTTCTVHNEFTQTFPDLPIDFIQPYPESGQSDEPITEDPDINDIIDTMQN
ncbi:MAG: penicillin-binding protein 1A [Bacillota bacterium]